MTVQDVYEKIDQEAPFAAQESFDNAGLLIGDPQAEVTGIHVALDVTDRVIDEAQANGANLIVTHHPLMFSPVQRITTQTYEGRLICRLLRSGISLIAAHTNLDRAPDGISMTLARCCRLEDIEGDSFLRAGNLPEPISAADFAQQLSSILRDSVRVLGDPDRLLRRVAVVSGAGSDFWQEALQAGADALVTGEVKHHLALEAAANGIVLLEAGHFATEVPGIFALADTLQNWIDALQYQVRVSKSQAGAYLA